MLENKKIYCELKFLEEFMDYRSALAINDISRSLNWWSILSVLDKTTLILDVDYTQMEYLTNSNTELGKFLKSKIRRANGVRLGKQKYPNLESSSPIITDEQRNSIFFTTKDEEICLSLSYFFGVSILNLEMLLSSKYAFKDNGISLPNDYVKSWNFLDDIQASCPKMDIGNSIIIADNYIIKKSKKAIKRNLRPILSHMFPPHIQTIKDHHVDINVYSLIKEDKGVINPSTINNFINAIKNIRRDIEINVTVYNVTKKDFHDRAIITNTVYIDCGRGFDEDLFANNIQSTNISLIFPFIQTAIEWASPRYLRVIEDAIRVEQNTLLYKDNYWGDKNRKNGLISYYLKQIEPTKGESIIVNAKPAAYAAQNLCRING